MKHQLACLALVALPVIAGCENAPFSYYPDNEAHVMDSDVKKSASPGSYAGTDSTYVDATPPAATAPIQPTTNVIVPANAAVHGNMR